MIVQITSFAHRSTLYVIKVHVHTTGRLRGVLSWCREVHICLFIGQRESKVPMHMRYGNMRQRSVNCREGLVASRYRAESH